MFLSKKSFFLKDNSMYLYLQETKVNLLSY